MKKSSVTRVAPYAVLLLAFLVIPAFFHSNYWLGIFIIVLYKIICSVSLRTISLSGNLTFAHGAFVALGAYCAGILAKNFGLPPVVTILAGGLFAALVSVLTGLPFVRLKGLYYSMASMFMGVTFIYIIKAMKITGGYRGLTGIPSMFSSSMAAYYFFVVLAVVCLAVLYRFEHCRIGTTLRALAQSQDVASSIGVNATYYRLLTIGISSFFAGVAGGAYALYSAVLSTTNYDMNFSLWLLMYMMIGGEDTFIGPIIGTILFVLIPECARGISSYSPYVVGVCMLLVAYLLPGGLVSIPGVIRKQLDKRKGGKDTPVSAEGGNE